MYSTTLEKHGFKINPYDRCVANKVINGKQCTIVFYVDDNKISHVDPEVVTSVLTLLKQHFGDLSVTRGKKHNFLGMDMLFQNDGTVRIEMKEQLQGVINLVDPKSLNDKVSSPATKKLFDVDDEAEQLDKVDSDRFHSIVAKLLYISKRSRPDLDTAVAFLTTRVSKSTVEDWSKLLRLLSYARQTIDDARIIGATTLKRLVSWIDAAYAVHPDMKSHTGASTSFGRGVISTKSSKQRLNTKSSTEAELVGVSDYLPHCVWFLYFLDHQGYKLSDNIILQDNQSAILMEKNGRNSCTGNSRHINVRFFFVKDRVANKEVVIKYCPTEFMLADFYTKALQGSLFNRFRDVLMGYKDISHLKLPIDLKFKECVGNSSNIPVNSRKINKIAYEENNNQSKYVRIKNNDQDDVLNKKGKNIDERVRFQPDKEYRVRTTRCTYDKDSLAPKKRAYVRST